MENPRPEKVAVVSEVRERLDEARAAILTEYRGLTVADMAGLRRTLRAAGGDYKVYKNTLVKLAVSEGPHAVLEPLLDGPTAIAFVSGDVSAVAKALRDYARTHPSLVVKGGQQPEGFLSAQDLALLADLPSRDVLLAQVAGGFAAPLTRLAALMQALTRNLAFGLSALIDQRGGAPDSDATSASSDGGPDERSGTATAEAGTATPETGGATAEADRADPKIERGDPRDRVIQRSITTWPRP